MRVGESASRLACRLGLVAGLLAGVGLVGGVRAGEPAAPAASGAGANPFANPMMNPYLNPYMTAQPITPQASMLYFMAAQRATGGIGSGRLSGSRPDPVPRGAEERRPSPRSVPTRQEPAGAAAGYFHRGQSATRSEPPARFGRHNRYFPDNTR